MTPSRGGLVHPRRTVHYAANGLSWPSEHRPSIGIRSGRQLCRAMMFSCRKSTNFPLITCSEEYPTKHMSHSPTVDDSVLAAVVLGSGPTNFNPTHENTHLQH